MNDILFEWDENKNLSNIKKHGVSFEEAKSVFYDDHAIEYFDIDHSGNDERFIMLGLSYKLNLLILCYCVRESYQIIRIISARKATKKESIHYTGGKI